MLTSFSLKKQHPKQAAFALTGKYPFMEVFCMYLFPTATMSYHFGCQPSNVRTQRVQIFQTRKMSPLPVPHLQFLQLIVHQLNSVISGGYLQEDGEIRRRKSDQKWPHQPLTTQKITKSFITQLLYVVTCLGLNKMTKWLLGWCQHIFSTCLCRMRQSYDHLRLWPCPGFFSELNALCW